MAKIITARDLYRKEYPEDNNLWGNFIERSALNSLIGGSDSGKSTLFRTLAVAIVKGDKEFLGFPLRPRYNRVLIVSIEDGEAAVGRMFQKFYKEFSDLAEMEDLHFMFEYTGDLQEELKAICEMNPYDLIMVDCYSDAYTGQSGNDQMQTKKFLRSFDELAKTYDAGVLFLHHLNKSANEGNVGKQDSMGSAAFEQKMRTLFSLNKDGYHSTKRALAIIKGNYVSSKDKSVKHILNFNEEEMSFTYIDCQELIHIADKVTDELRMEVVQFLKDIKVGKKKDGGTSFMEATKIANEKFNLKFGKSTYHNWYDELVDEVDDDPPSFTEII